MENTNETLGQYTEKVLEYLEYLEFQYYILHFDPRQLAKVMQITTMMMFISRASYRMAALTIFSYTMQVIKRHESMLDTPCNPTIN